MVNSQIIGSLGRDKLTAEIVGIVRYHLEPSSSSQILIDICGSVLRINPAFSAKKAKYAFSCHWWYVRYLY